MNNSLLIFRGNDGRIALTMHEAGFAAESEHVEMEEHGTGECVVMHASHFDTHSEFGYTLTATAERLDYLDLNNCRLLNRTVLSKWF